MSEKEETGRCWVVRWRMEGKSSVLQDFVHVLPWRWNSEHVEEYLFSLYYNSSMMPVSKRTGWMDSKVGTGLLVLKEKNRVVVGQGPFLVVDRVKDFSVTDDASRGVEILTYTEPDGTRFDIEGGKVLKNSAPVQVKFELRNPGIRE